MGLEDYEDYFTCGVCTQLMGAPFSMTCGHLLCGACLLRWLKDHPTCPVCRARLTAPPARCFAIESFVKEKLLTLVQPQTGPDADVLPHMDQTDAAAQQELTPAQLAAQLQAVFEAHSGWRGHPFTRAHYPGAHDQAFSAQDEPLDSLIERQLARQAGSPGSDASGSGGWPGWDMQAADAAGEALAVRWAAQRFPDQPGGSEGSAASPSPPGLDASLGQLMARARAHMAGEAFGRPRPQAFLPGDHDGHESPRTSAARLFTWLDPPGRNEVPQRSQQGVQQQGTVAGRSDAPAPLRAHQPPSRRLTASTSPDEDTFLEQLRWRRDSAPPPSAGWQAEAAPTSREHRSDPRLVEGSTAAAAARQQLSRRLWGRRGASPGPLAPAELPGAADSPLARGAPEHPAAHQQATPPAWDSHMSSFLIPPYDPAAEEWAHPPNQHGVHERAGTRGGLIPFGHSSWSETPGSGLAEQLAALRSEARSAGGEWQQGAAAAARHVAPAAWQSVAAADADTHVQNVRPMRLDARPARAPSPLDGLAPLPADLRRRMRRLSLYDD